MEKKQKVEEKLMEETRKIGETRKKINKRNEEKLMKKKEYKKRMKKQRKRRGMNIKLEKE